MRTGRDGNANDTGIEIEIGRKGGGEIKRIRNRDRFTFVATGTGERDESADE
jgi:hypothetical protein